MFSLASYSAVRISSQRFFFNESFSPMSTAHENRETRPFSRSTNDTSTDAIIMDWVRITSMVRTAVENANCQYRIYVEQPSSNAR